MPCCTVLSCTRMGIYFIAYKYFQKFYLKLSGPSQNVTQTELDHSSPFVLQNKVICPSKVSAD